MTVSFFFGVLHMTIYMFDDMCVDIYIYIFSFLELCFDVLTDEFFSFLILDSMSDASGASVL